MLPDDMEKLVDELAALPEGEDREARLQSLTPQEMKDLGEYNASILADIKARRKELDRQNDKPNPSEEPVTPVIPAAVVPEDPALQPPADDYGKKLREENRENARDSVYTRLGLTSEDFPAADQMFIKLDDGSVTQARLEKVYTSAVAAAFPDKLASAQETLNKMKENADDFTQNNAGAGSGTGEGGDGTPPISQGAQDLINEGKRKGVEFTPEQAEKIDKEGMSRTY